MHVRTLQANNDRSHAMLQAYVDDSIGNGPGRRLVLAGYLADVETWRAFSDDWKRNLRAAPSISFLHMVEAQNLRGEFKGWSASKRDRKIMRLARLVNNYSRQMSSFHFTISLNSVKEHMNGKVPYGLSSGYYLAFHTLVQQIARYLDTRYPPTTVEFIFDEQNSLQSDAINLFSFIKSTIPHHHSKYLDKPPIFRSDTDMIALQSADMLAWHLRRRHDNAGDNLPAYDLLFGHEHVSTNIDTDTIKRLSSQISRIPGIKRLINKQSWRSASSLVERTTSEGGKHRRYSAPVMRIMHTIDEANALMRPLRKRILRRIRQILR